MTVSNPIKSLSSELIPDHSFFGCEYSFYQPDSHIINYPDVSAASSHKGVIIRMGRKQCKLMGIPLIGAIFYPGRIMIGFTHNN